MLGEHAYNVKISSTKSMLGHLLAGAGAIEAIVCAKAIENGFFFTAPAQAKAQPSMAKGFATLYREIARAGVAYETTVQIKFEGGGMMGSMMNKMAGMSMTTTFNTVSSDTIADAQFEVPAGYKVKQGK